MKYTLLILFIFSSGLISGQDIPPYAYDRIIVNLRDDLTISPEDIIEHQRFNIPVLDRMNNVEGFSHIKLLGNREIARSYTISFHKEKNIDELVKQYEALGLFKYVEPDYTGFAGGKKMEFLNFFPNDNFWARQWSLYNDGSFNLSTAIEDADIDMESAWDIEQGSDEIIVAILDSGLRLQHPEFQDRLWKNSIDTLDGIDNDSNGYIDDIFGYNFAYENGTPYDDLGHGTNIGGIIGANGNNLYGYAGVDWNCQLITCKILNSENWGYYSWWVDAIYYAVNNGASVLNMSVGGSNPSIELENAVDWAYNNNAIIVACMMNFNNGEPYYPAAFEKTIAVGSTNANDERSEPFFWSTESGSNYGDHIDVSAPGNYIYGLDNWSDTNMSSYWGGTSQATPHVTGLVSLLLAQDPERSFEDIRAIIQTSADDMVGKASEDTPGFDIYHGHGRLNAYNALMQGQTANQTKVRKQYQINPNPVDANNPKLQIQNVESGKNEIRLFNNEGKIVFSQNIYSENNQISLKLPKLAAGTYFLNLNNKTQTIIFK